MRKLALLTSLLGISLLVLISYFSPPIKVHSPKDLQELEDNQKVEVEGLVIKEYPNPAYKTLILNNSLQLQFYSNAFKNVSFLNKTIIALGKLDSYNNKKTIKILEIKCSIV